ncbi:Hypothetical protein I595_1762 [Croceitalea dokdonensis DOKDO 023]|uniref:DUF4136 domain-containing protein n=1 Tax=Croceitalea dokdonensis DOKDO 023 TaxID=1300341 RepID=A0A0P7AZS7_9FLAO|nr:DUF4136 domain-containing protein [Croceitalea dokdonensis]KPM32112.1 Hypothetical protein I595_1762 [Croceitalea dokdonensis DOKDO 023]
MGLWIFILGTAVVVIFIVVISRKQKKVLSKKKTEKNLQQFKTYAFLPERMISWPDLEKENDTDVSELAVNTVNKNMISLGYELNLTNPDLLVLLKTGKVRANKPVYASFPYSATLPTHPVYSAFSYRGYQIFNEIKGYNTAPATDGVWLRIDIVEQKNKEVLWTAASNEAIYFKKKPEELIAYINEMFKAYPQSKN